MDVALIELAAMFAVFGLAARIVPCNPAQPRFVTRDFIDNALWWALGVLLYGDVAGLMIRGGAELVTPGHGEATAATVAAGYGLAASAPLWVQVLVILVVMDFIQYWLHRLFHGRTLWPFHAVHHSAEELDWTTTFRVHPVNFLIYSAAVYALVRAFGFAPVAWIIVGLFNLVIGALVHANLNWTWGPLRYVIASPVFHRWHHVKDASVHDKNFAPTFPVWDLMFGTFHMPRGIKPQDYGVEGAPVHFLPSLVWPFRELGRRFAAPRKPQRAAQLTP
jgi:sterol desaturase/sphingolipid hydroxylase (fatty acid hydroxylase superfamily)